MYHKRIRGAGMITCLFLFHCLNLSAQDWSFSPATQAAYDLVLDLQLEEALAQLPEPKTAEEVYVVSLAQALDLIITEDAEKYQDYHDAYEARLGKRTKS